MSDLYAQYFSTARTLSPHIRSNLDVDSQYLTELLAEHQKIGPFMQVLPVCSRLLNQEILRVSGMASNHGFSDFDRLQYGSPSPMSSFDIMPNNRGTGSSGRNGLPQERLGGPQGMNMNWKAAPASLSSYFVKRVLRLDIPVDSYPNFNFIGRLLGPRGNSLRRVEAFTGCRVFIRGKGSIKDLDKEESLKRRPGYEHLNGPLHILIEAEFPASVIDLQLRQAQEILEELLKPDESQDLYKTQQLRELAMIDSNFREGSPQLSGSISPFITNGMKRAKTDVSKKKVHLLPLQIAIDLPPLRKRSRSSKSWGSHLARPLDEVRVASQEERDCAFEAAVELESSLKSGNPSFVKSMLEMVLEDEDGVEFEATYIGKRTGLSGGWRAFALDHKLDDGDAVVFELTEPTKFKVSIFRAFPVPIQEQSEETEHKEVISASKTTLKARTQKSKKAAAHSNDDLGHPKKLQPESETNSQERSPEENPTKNGSVCRRTQEK